MIAGFFRLMMFNAHIGEAIRGQEFGKIIDRIHPGFATAKRALIVKVPQLKGGEGGVISVEVIKFAFDRGPGMGAGHLGPVDAGVFDHTSSIQTIVRIESRG